MDHFKEKQMQWVIFCGMSKNEEKAVRFRVLAAVTMLS
jgi:hypothetical protein